MARRALFASLALVTGVTTAMATLGATRAHADDLDLPGLGARSIGRAGVGVVSSDDGAALAYDPAGLARRGTLRLQLGVSLSDRSATFDSAETFPCPTGMTCDAARARDEAGAEALPAAAVEFGLGSRVVIGLATFTPTDVSYAFAGEGQTDYDHPAVADRWNYPARYAATQFHLSRRAIGAGVAVRAFPWLAVGASALIYDVRLDHARDVWGGDPALGDSPEDPSYDMALSLETRDRFVPGGALGVIVAPEGAPVELGLSVTFAANATLTGTPALRDSRGSDSVSLSRNATATVAPDATVRLVLPSPLVARAGVRFFGPRAALEIDGQLTRGGGESRPVFSLTGVSVTRRGGAPVAIAAVPLGPALDDGWALRAAADVDLIPGFLLVTAGYAYARALVPRSSLSTALPDLDAHTVAAGAEARLDGVTVSLGVSHTMSFSVDVDAGETSIRPIAPVASTPLAPVGQGRYGSGATLVGLSVEIELP